MNYCDKSHLLDPHFTFELKTRTILFDVDNVIGRVWIVGLIYTTTHTLDII